MPRDHRRGGGGGSGGARARGPGKSASAPARGGESESVSASALVCQGCGRGFASLRCFNGHHSSPYVKPQCRGREKGVDEDMVVTSRDVRVRSRVRVDAAAAAEAQGTRYIQALYKQSTHNVHAQSMQNTYNIQDRYKCSTC